MLVRLILNGADPANMNKARLKKKGGTQRSRHQGNLQFREEGPGEEHGGGEGVLSCTKRKKKSLRREAFQPCQGMIE